MVIATAAGGASCSGSDSGVTSSHTTTIRSTTVVPFPTTYFASDPRDVRTPKAYRAFAT